MSEDPTIHFCVDEPRTKTVVVYKSGPLVFTGWAFHAGDGPVRVEVIGPNATHEAVADRLRPDVRAVFARVGVDAPERCGFRLEIPGGPALRGRHVVRFHCGPLAQDGGVYEMRPFSSMRWDQVERAPVAPTGAGLPRERYKEVWNASARDMDQAKTAVAGYTSEADFDLAAHRTMGVLKETVGVRKEDEVLEIGCGVGRMAPWMARCCRRWVGVDVSENMIAHARQRTGQLENVEYGVVSGWDLAALGDETFDLVYCTVVFMHLDEWDRFNYVCEAKRVLRPGGRLFVDNYNLLSRAGWEYFMQHAVEIHPLDRPPNISKSSTPEELRCYLERAGFDEVRVDASDDMWVCAWGRKPG